MSRLPKSRPTRRIVSDRPPDPRLDEIVVRVRSKARCPHRQKSAPPRQLQPPGLREPLLEFHKTRAGLGTNEPKGHRVRAVWKLGRHVGRKISDQFGPALARCGHEHIVLVHRIRSRRSDLHPSGHDGPDRIQHILTLRPHTAVQECTPLLTGLWLFTSRTGLRM